MDRHQAFQCFCRVVETGGFAAAARDLDHSPSMITKTIQQLEEWTGSRLLARTTRRMQLTEAGERFYAYCRRVLDDTERTLSALRAAHGELCGRLVLAVPVSLTLSFLKDHLHAFQSAHPGIELEVRLSDRPVDLVRDGVDVALRGRAQLEDSSLVAVPLMVMHRAVAAARTTGGATASPSIRRRWRPTTACPTPSAPTVFAGSSPGPTAIARPSRCAGAFAPTTA